MISRPEDDFLIRLSHRHHGWFNHLRNHTPSPAILAPHANQALAPREPTAAPRHLKAGRTHLPLVLAERDAFLAGQHLSVLLVVLANVHKDHALERTYVHELLVAQLFSQQQQQQ